MDDEVVAFCFGDLLADGKSSEPFKRGIKNELEVFQERLVQGASYLITKVSDAQEFEKLAHFTKTLTVKEAREQYVHDLDHKKSLSEQCGISDVSLEEMYRAAKELYEHRQWSQARSCFTFLTLLQPFRYAFWLGLANCEFYCHAFEPSLMAYALAVQINPSDPVPHIYSSRCYEEQMEWDNAINALDLALFVIAQNSGYSDWRQKIEEEKVRLTRRKR